MSDPIDQPKRTLFITELTRNFSVVASAGSGKTRAITDRIIAIATSEHALEWLPTLVVVTFTNRAADEMQQRARQRILEEGVSLEVLAAFNRAFFGTIHSFCVKLLRQHGHHLGLPGALDLLTDDDALWMEFMQHQTAVGAGLTAAQRRCLLRLAPVRQLMELGRHGGADGAGEEPGDFPALAFDDVHSFVATGSSKKTIPLIQQRLRDWERDWAEGEGFLPMPVCSSKAKEFVPLWEAAMGPIREWLRRCSLHIAAEVGDAYRDFRLAKGAINYDDQIALASQLLRHPEAARRIRGKNHRVILDEAQDTDPVQFAVLLGVARPPEAEGAWPDTENAPPRPGHFCMVGDFQQSIFGDRADLAHYREIHEALLAVHAGKVEFSVTFRLDREQIGFVNATFPSVLHDQEGQVAFVELNPRPTVLPGQVVRFDLGDLPDTKGWKSWQRERLEAQRLASWLRAQGLERLRAQSWREVAVLCPRKGWFAPLRAALRAEGFEVQIQSERDIKGDSPAYAWFAALAAIMAEPRHGYEIVGVLREVFGLSDHDLAAFAGGNSGRFHIAEPPVETGAVADTLRLLAELRARVEVLPLFSAMQEVVRATQLRERLLALPAEYEDPGADIDDLLTLAATAEADKRTLFAFAEELRAGFTATREVRTTARDAIQLITCHKAKGSEWQAVIVPYFARAATQRSRGYPRLIRHPGTRAAFAVLDAADIDAELKGALDTECRQELERLFYVALTRAKHTLVLAHDHALFTGKNAPAQLLRCGDGSPFAALTDAPVACAATSAQQQEKAAHRAREESVLALTPFPSGEENAARERATLFIKRNPSALAEAALADADPAAYLEMSRRATTGQSDGARYGDWWHGFIEQIDWRADAAAWDATFAAALADSPEPHRSRAEWTLLRDQLTGGSGIARLLTAPGLVAHAEMPFLWAMSGRECLEGIIDLAVFDPAAGSWLIVDWKTNRRSADELPQLSAHYLPQLSAYWKAASAMLGVPVAAGLYSTATGAWLRYDVAALPAAWERLSREPESISRVLGER